MRPEHQGFTLIELMISLVVVGILTALALPGFRGLILDSRRSDAVNELIIAFQTARSEAVRKGRVAAVCASEDGQHCSDDYDWNKGWIVFVNNGAVGDDTSARDDATEELIRAYTQPSRSLNIVASNPPVRFEMPSFASTALAKPGHVAVCDSRGLKESKSVIVATSGTVRTADAETGDCP